MGVVRATIRAEAVASVKERLLCGPLSHDTQGKAKSYDGVRIFLVRDDELRWNVCVVVKLYRHGSNSHLALGPALAAHQNIRCPGASRCSKLHRDRAQGSSRIRIDNAAPAVLPSSKG